MSKARAAMETPAKPAAAGNDGTDQALDSNRKSRGYNPINDAARGNTSAALNSDAAKYKKPANGQ